MDTRTSVSELDPGSGIFYLCKLILGIRCGRFKKRVIFF
jgi:hypothetical protein